MTAVAPHEQIIQVVAKPISEGTAYEHRPMLNRSSKDSIKILHEIPKSKFVDGCWQKTWKMLCPCCYWKCDFFDCFKTLKKQMRESEYTWVMENRIEVNRPYARPKNECCSICLCRWRVVDRTEVVYYDDDIMFERMVLRHPCCCYEYKTSCCGSWGETIQFRFLCAGCPSDMLCGPIFTLTVTEGTGQECLDLIKKVRENAKAKMTT